MEIQSVSLSNIGLAELRPKTTRRQCCVVIKVTDQMIAYYVFCILL